MSLRDKDVVRSFWFGVTCPSAGEFLTDYFRPGAVYQATWIARCSGTDSSRDAHTRNRFPDIILSSVDRASSQAVSQDERRL